MDIKIPLTGGKSRGYGFVQFRKKEDAEQAMKGLAGASFNGKPIFIEPYRRRPRLNPEETFTNVYFKNLPESIKTVDQIKELFAPFGEIVVPCLPLNSDGVPLGFGFCNMAEHEAAVRAVQALNGKEIDGKIIEACRFKNRAERQQEIKDRSLKYQRDQYEKTKNRDLYIRGFDETVTDEQLKETFSAFGPLESTKIQRDESGTSLKFGFALFVNDVDANKALKESINLQINGNQIYVAYWKPKHMLQAQNQQQHHGTNRAAHQSQSAQMMTPAYPSAQYPNPMAPPQYGGYPAMGPNPMNSFNPAIAPANPRTLLRQGVMEYCQENGYDSNEVIGRIRSISEDQAKALINDQDLLAKWIKNE